MDRNRATLARVASVQPLAGLSARLEFTDGTIAEIDLAEFMRGPVFDVIRADSELFRQVKVDQELGTIVWPNGADIDPDVLWSTATGGSLIS